MKWLHADRLRNRKQHTRISTLTSRTVQELHEEEGGTTCILWVNSCDMTVERVGVVMGLWVFVKVNWNLFYTTSMLYMYVIHLQCSSTSFNRSLCRDAVYDNTCIRGLKLHPKELVWATRYTMTEKILHYAEEEHTCTYLWTPSHHPPLPSQSG